MIRNSYKFYITFPSGIAEVFPLNSTLTFVDEYNTAYNAFRKKLDTELVFRNTDEHKTFDAFAALDNMQNQCYEVDLQVQYSSDGENFSLAYTGLIPLKKGKYNFSECTFKVKPEINDVFSCINKIAKVDFNLLRIPEKQRISTVEGVVECEIVNTANGNVPVAPDGVGWAISNTELTYYFDDLVLPSYSYTFCRIRYNGTESDPAGFTLDPDGNYYAPPNLADPITFSTPVFYIEPTQIDSQSSVQVGEKVTTTLKIVNIDIDNGVALEGIFDLFFADCGITLKSDFFNINADGTAPDNGAYTYAENYLQELIFLQASDVVRADNEEFKNATRFNITFEKFWSNIKHLNLQMIDEGSNVLRIEHISYSEENLMLDLTQPKFEKHMVGKSEYSYEQSNIPRKEVFSFKYATGVEAYDFDDAFIDYDSNCSNEDEKKYTMAETITNIGYLYSNSSIENDIDKMKGVMCIVSTNSGSINNSTGAITGVSVLNAAMSFANIIQALWLWKRPLMSGNMNGRVTQFLSSTRNKKQTAIQIPMIKSDYFEVFKPQDLVRTIIGWGEPVSVKYETPQDILELELNH